MEPFVNFDVKHLAVRGAPGRALREAQSLLISLVCSERHLVPTPLWTSAKLRFQTCVFRTPPPLVFWHRRRTRWHNGFSLSFYFSCCFALDAFEQGILGSWDVKIQELTNCVFVKLKDAIMLSAHCNFLHLTLCFLNRRFIASVLCKFPKSRYYIKNFLEQWHGRVFCCWG